MPNSASTHANALAKRRPLPRAALSLPPRSNRKPDRVEVAIAGFVDVTRTLDISSEMCQSGKVVNKSA